METVLELEKTASETPPVARKKFRAEEVYKMVEVGILPEASGWELIDGEILEKMPSGSKHAGTIKRLNKLLTKLVGNQAIISVQDPIHLDESNEPKPDLALLKLRDDFYTENHPQPEDILLLIEVSDSSVEFDREYKKNLYAEAGIGEFWLVNLKDGTVEVYSQPKNGNYRLARILEKGEVLQSTVVEGLSLKIEEILGS